MEQNKLELKLLETNNFIIHNRPIFSHGNKQFKNA